MASVKVITTVTGTGCGGIKIGSGASVGRDGLAIGQNARSGCGWSQYTYNVALGDSATAMGGSSTAVGTGATAGGRYSTALGHHASASGDCSTALGTDATATFCIPIAIKGGGVCLSANGSGVYLNGTQIGGGGGGSSTSICAETFGDYCNCRAYTTRLGSSSLAYGAGVAVGACALAGFCSVAIGQHAHAAISRAIAIGRNAMSGIPSGIAIGACAYASCEQPVVIRGGSSSNSNEVCMYVSNSGTLYINGRALAFAN